MKQPKKGYVVLQLYTNTHSYSVQEFIDTALAQYGLSEMKCLLEARLFKFRLQGFIPRLSLFQVSQNAELE